jgi:hypothetical protein
MQIPLFDNFPSSSTTVPNISYPRSTGLVFASSALVTNVGAVFTGFITFPSPGKWSVSLSSDDGTRFFFWPEGSYPRVFNIRVRSAHIPGAGWPVDEISSADGQQE